MHEDPMYNIMTDEKKTQNKVRWLQQMLEKSSTSESESGSEHKRKSTERQNGKKRKQHGSKKTHLRPKGRNQSQKKILRSISTTKKTKKIMNLSKRKKEEKNISINPETLAHQTATTKPQEKNIKVTITTDNARC